MGKNRDKKGKQKGKHQWKVPAAASHGLDDAPRAPRIEPAPDPEELLPVWRFGVLDCGGPWGWATHPAANVGPALFEIRERLASFEQMKWREIRMQKNTGKTIEVESICSEARKRLVDIGQEDVPALFELRIDRQRRLWGIRDGQVFNVLWWDPDHTVYPMNVTGNDSSGDRHKASSR